MKINRLVIILVLGMVFSSVNAETLENQKTRTFLTTFKQNCWKSNDYWFAKDKMQHFSTSMFIFLTDYYYQDKYCDYSTKAIARNSYTLSLSFGIGKEILDFTGPNPYFSLKDLIVDFSGIVVGNIIVNNIK